MLNTSCRKTGLQDNEGNAAVASSSSPVVLQEAAADKLRLQACWIRLWDRWACEQRNLVLYQMHINHALSRERSKLTLAGGRVVSCKRVKQQHQSSASGDRCTAAAGDRQPRLPPRPSGCDRPPCLPPRPSGRDSPPQLPTRPIADDVATAPEVLGCTGARDLRVLSAAVDRLRASGWYYEGAEQHAAAAAALSAMPAGRFCVRDSKHSEHLFTMDVQTGHGRRLLSVRFTYADGAFGLDSMQSQRAGGNAAAAAMRVPEFRCPIELIDYYLRLSRIAAARLMPVYPVWIDQCGRFFSWMNLRKPMVKTDAAGFPSLKHMARLVINRHKRLITITPTSLPNELIEYLLQYPYSL